MSPKDIPYKNEQCPHIRRGMRYQRRYLSIIAVVYNITYIHIQSVAIHILVKPRVKPLDIIGQRIKEHEN